MDSSTQATIVEAGIAAPSADNSQPWHFAWHGNALEVSIDATRSGSVSDTRYVLSDLATGACIENLLLCGRTLGYNAQVTWFPRTSDPLLVARLDWHRRVSGWSAEPLAEAIMSRHTDRRFPWRGPLDPAMPARLNAEAMEIPGQRLFWPAAGAPLRAARRVIRQAETLRFRSPMLHAELFSTLRFDVGWRGHCDEGLAPATLAVEAPMRALFQSLRRPAVMRPLRWLGTASMLGVRSAWLPLRLSPGLCLVVSQGDTRADMVGAGRALQRVWLRATLEGLSVQPYAAAGVLSLGLIPIEAGLRPAMARLAQALKDLCGPGQGVIFLRLGQARTPLRQRNGRRPLGDFLPPE